LCLECHGDAHTVHQLSQNLTPDKIVAHKEYWLQIVEDQDVAAANNIVLPSPGDVWWDYFNHKRIINTANKLNVDPASLSGYQELLKQGIINKIGEPIISASTQASYLYDSVGGHDQTLANYYAEYIAAIVEKATVWDLTEIYDQDFISENISTGDVITVKGCWRFKKLHKKFHVGSLMNREAYIVFSGIRIQFTIDAWECTSSSSTTNLSGYWPCLGILLVRSVCKNDHKVTIHGSGLAIGTKV